MNVLEKSMPLRLPSLRIQFGYYFEHSRLRLLVPTLSAKPPMSIRRHDHNRMTIQRAHSQLNQMGVA